MGYIRFTSTACHFRFSDVSLLFIHSVEVPLMNGNLTLLGLRLDDLLRQYDTLNRFLPKTIIV